MTPRVNVNKKKSRKSLKKAMKEVGKGQVCHLMLPTMGSIVWCGPIV